MNLQQIKQDIQNGVIISKVTRNALVEHALQLEQALENIRIVGDKRAYDVATEALNANHLQNLV